MKLVKYEEYQPRSVLNVHKRINGGWFWSKYNADPYIGCYYGCAYSYCRNEKYSHIARERKASGLKDPFSQHIRIKTNVVELFEKSLRNKPREIVYLDQDKTGSQL